MQALRCDPEALRGLISLAVRKKVLPNVGAMIRGAAPDLSRDEENPAAVISLPYRVIRILITLFWTPIREYELVQISALLLSYFRQMFLLSADFCGMFSLCGKFSTML